MTDPPHDPDRLAEIRIGPMTWDDVEEVVSDRLKSLVAEVERLRGLLARLEWASGKCPACSTFGHPSLRHAPGCELATALAGNDKGAPPK